MTNIVATFYKFVSLPDFENFKIIFPGIVAGNLLLIIIIYVDGYIDSRFVITFQMIFT